MQYTENKFLCSKFKRNNKHFNLHKSLIDSIKLTIK